MYWLGDEVTIYGGLGFGEVGIAGFDDGLGTVGDLELVEDIGDMVADGFGGNVEVVGDVGVAFALRDE